jgi:hypothetical protein
MLFSGTIKAVASAATLLAACAVYDDSMLGGPSASAGGSERLVGAGGNGSGGSAGGAGSLDTNVAGHSGGSDSYGGAGGAVVPLPMTDAGPPIGAGGTTTLPPLPEAGASGASVKPVADAAAAPADAGNEAGALTEELIDDMEDGNEFIFAVDGRRGTWSVGNDGTPGGEQEPRNPFVMTLIPSGRGKSKYAAYTSGHGFTGWGTVMLVALNQLNNDPKEPYDASGYLGVTFWAKVGEGATTKYKVRIADVSTLPEGKVCVLPACNDHHELVDEWSTTWTKYVYWFADLHQEGWGDPQKPFDPAHIYDIEFQTADAQPFDFWIDDLAFVKK